MRFTRLAMVLIVLVVALASAASAQGRREIAGLSWEGIPHPASAALVFYDTLQLSESQIARLRAITDRLEASTFNLIATTIGDTTRLLRLWRTESIDSAALTHQAHANADAHARVELHMLRARDETFAILTAEQRTLLERLIRDRLFGSESANERRACHAGSGSGGYMKLSENVGVVFSTEVSRNGVHIRGIVVGRADTKLYSSDPATSQPPHPGSGGTMGRWWFIVDTEKQVAWVDTQRVALDGNNVVLVQGVDRLTRRPDVVGLVRVPTVMYVPDCGSDAFRNSLKAHLLSNPRVRAFVER